MSSEKSRAPRQKRSKTICTISLNTAQCFDPCDGKSFFISWQRGKRTGSTEKCLADAQGMIFFYKTVRLQLTLRKKQRKKIMKLKLVQCEGTKQKTIGKLTISLMDFPGHHKCRNLPMVGKGTQAPVLGLSVVMVADASETTESEIDKSMSLESMSTEVSEKSTGMLEMRRRESVDLPQGVRPQSTSVPREENIRMDRKMSAMMNDFLGSSSMLKQRSSGQSEEEIDGMTALARVFERFVSEEIPYSDTSLTDFDGADSMLFALMCDYGVLGDLNIDSFSRFKNEIAVQVIDSPVIESMDKRRGFFPMFGLCALLRYPPAEIECNQRRCDELVDMFLMPTARYLNRLLKSYIVLFDNSIEQLFEGESSGQAIVQLFDEDFRTFMVACQVPIQFVKAVREAVVCILDMHIIQAMIGKYESKCTFLQTMTWNSFCTIMSSDCAANFTKFKEATTALQMVTEIANSPGKLGMFCPNLSPRLALRIMRMRQPDDQLDTLPDFEPFKAAYNIKDEASDIEEVATKALADIIIQSCEDVDTDKWKGIHVPEKLRSEYQFIRRYFA